MGRFVEAPKILKKDNGISIDLENYNDLYPALHYLITFSIGMKIREPVENSWDRRLEEYLMHARGPHDLDAIYKTVSKVMSQVSLGVRKR